MLPNNSDQRKLVFGHAKKALKLKCCNGKRDWLLIKKNTESLITIGVLIFDLWIIYFSVFIDSIANAFAGSSASVFDSNSFDVTSSFFDA